MRTVDATPTADEAVAIAQDAVARLEFHLRARNHVGVTI